MPHVVLVPFTGFRVREPEMLEVGMRLPGLRSRAEAIGRLPALGLLTLAAHNPENWTSSYRPAGPSKDELDALIEEILDSPPDLVAVSALTASVDSAIQFSAALRHHGIQVAIGGLHATAAPESLTPHFDAVVVGDGEPVWKVLLHDAEKRRLRSIYRTTHPFNLNDAQVPRFDLLNGAPLARMTLQTQRGCPFACEFCGASRLLGRFREKPSHQIRKELAAIRAIDDEPVIELADDNTFAGTRDVHQLFDVLSDAKVRYFTEADWRIGERPDVLEGLAQSGCVQVLVGMESLAAQPRGMGAKKASLERIMDAVCAIQDHGVCVIGCFIVGVDGETNASIDHLIEFVLASPLADVQLTINTPFPGTPLYARLKRAGRLLADRGWSSYTLFDATYAPDPMSVEALEGGFVRAARVIFSEGPAQRRLRIRRNVWLKYGRRQQCR